MITIIYIYTYDYTYIYIVLIGLLNVRHQQTSLHGPILWPKSPAHPAKCGWVPIATGSASNAPTSEGDRPLHVSLWLTPTWSHMCHKLTYLDHLIILLTSIDRFQSPQLNPFGPHSLATSPSFLGLKNPHGFPWDWDFIAPSPESPTSCPTWAVSVDLAGPRTISISLAAKNVECFWWIPDGPWKHETLKGELRKKDGFESLEKLVDLSLETIEKLVFQMI